MKNVFGKQEALALYNKEGKLVYEFYEWIKVYWIERTYDSNGNTLTYKNSTGYWYESTYDSNGKQLTYKDSDGYWTEKTYDSNGNELTYKNSDGVMIGFDIPEYTMEELVEKLGNFKIKK